MSDENTNEINRSEDDLQPEYDFDYSKAKPNLYAQHLRERQVLVALDPDVATVFRSAEEVNRVLRALIQTMPSPVS
jgi:hypothetical protein